MVSLGHEASLRPSKAMSVGSWQLPDVRTTWEQIEVVI